MGHGYLSRWALWLVVAVAFGGTRSTTMQAHVMPGGGARVDRVRTLAVQGSDRRSCARTLPRPAFQATALALSEGLAS